MEVQNRDRKTEVFQVSNDDTVVAQRRFEDKQPEEKTNTDCLVLQSIQQQNGLVKETNVTLLAKRLKTPIDMLGFFGWLASIKQWMLEPVKVKCIFMGYRKRYSRYGFNEGDEFEVEPHDGHTFEVEPHRNVDHVYREDSNEVAFAVAAVEKIYAHESLTFNDCEVISKWKAGLKDDMDARSDV
ncbi:hypothetical protein Tco_1025756 [Tanacetum coccineum]